MNNEENLALVTKGFNRLLNSLAPYIAGELIREYGNDDWWQRGVLGTLYEDQTRDLPRYGDFGELVDSLDIYCCLILMDVHWGNVFRRQLPRDCRSYVNELKNTRNRTAHVGSQGINDSDTFRALDTMSRLCEQVDPEGASDINALLRTARYGNSQGSVAVTSNTSQKAEPKKRPSASTLSARGLPSWREVMEPHQDVAEGRYRNAEFAADLSQVALGKGELEYRDPVEFFNRTYVTEGMKGLLVQSLKRVAGLDGEPVIQLKTAFGGGKTHSMLALYHMMRSRKRVAQVPCVREVMSAAGVAEAPDVHVAVIVGTAMNPAKAKRPATMPGVTVNTVWGEIAYQLAESKGDPSIYNYVKDADRHGVAPSSVDLADMFDACGCCLVLMDELVAYAKKLYGQEKLPAGTLDNFITFIQELTEAARASKCSLVVASIPESENEIGGEAGQRALEQIEHTFGRMEAIWKPVAAKEGFEVVRRRLFLNCKDEVAREEVCSAFSRMYGQNASDFPIDAKELEYRERMISCYPIHPEVFDRLYEDWATLERFQRTRGVLRLMAAVIHELWMGQDASPMIMPGSVPFDVPNVRDELTRYLDDNWNAVVDSEVDGKASVPFKNDKNQQRYGQVLASRRVARAVMLGSAPDVRGQSVRGIEKAHIRLGVVQPGENIAVFNDALSTLRTTSSFLYSDGSENRFWYDTRPTLRKIVEDRAQQVSDSDAEFEVVRRLRLLRKVAPFSGLHVCPSSSLDVPDEQALRLVVLAPGQACRGGSAGGAAVEKAADILVNRGTSPRMNKNMLAFVAADASSVAPMLADAKRYLAWCSIRDERVDLNLDAAQNRETEQSIRRTDASLDAKIQEAYRWLIAPRIDALSGSSEIEWEVDQIAGSGETVVQKAAAKMKSNEAAVDAWAPALLRMELDRLLWKDKQHLQIKQLWDYLCAYCYLPRLANYSVLEDAIRKGLGSTEFFGIAQGVGEDCYLGLSFGQPMADVRLSDFLVRPSAAKEQLEREQAEAAEAAKRRREREAAAGADASGRSVGGDEVGFDDDRVAGGDVIQPDGGHSERVQLPTAFAMSAKLDVTRVNRDVRTIMDEIVSQLMQLDGSCVELSLEVRARVGEGIPVPATRAISENCNTLHISEYRFDG